MDFIHRVNRSQWDEAYTDARVTTWDVQAAIVIVAVFMVLALFS